MYPFRTLKPSKVAVKSTFVISLAVQIYRLKTVFRKNSAKLIRIRKHDIFFNNTAFDIRKRKTLTSDWYQNKYYHMTYFYKD